MLAPGSAGGLLAFCAVCTSFVDPLLPPVSLFAMSRTATMAAKTAPPMGIHAGKLFDCLPVTLPEST